MTNDCKPAPEHVAYVAHLRTLRRSTPAAPPHPRPATPSPSTQTSLSSTQTTSAPASAQERKVKLIISVDGYRSYLNDCEVNVVLKQEENYLPPEPGKLKADASGQMVFDEWVLPGKNCFIIASVMPSLKNIDGTIRTIPPGVAVPYVTQGNIPDDALGKIWFKLSPRLLSRTVDLGIESNDSTNRGSTSTTDKGSGSLSYGIATLGGEHSVTENSLSLTDGSKRTRTDHYTIYDVTGIELHFSSTSPIISADAGAPSPSGLA